MESMVFSSKWGFFALFKKLAFSSRLRRYSVIIVNRNPDIFRLNRNPDIFGQRDNLGPKKVAINKKILFVNGIS